MMLGMKSTTQHTTIQHPTIQHPQINTATTRHSSYGMLGFGHSPDAVLEAMCGDHVMANIMTPTIHQKNFISAMRKEVGHNRASGCPYASFLMMNSGSEGNSVADRLIDIHTGHVLDGSGFAERKVKCIALKVRLLRDCLLKSFVSSGYQPGIPFCI
jgi:hypothetical protein